MDKTQAIAHIANTVKDVLNHLNRKMTHE